MSIKKQFHTLRSLSPRKVITTPFPENYKNSRSVITIKIEIPFQQFLRRHYHNYHKVFMGGIPGTLRANTSRGNTQNL